MTDLIIRGAHAIVATHDRPPLINGWLAISDGIVSAMGVGAPPRGSAAVDARGCVVLPGMVAAHHHLSQGASRGISTPGGVIDWLAVHYRAWSRLTANDVGAAAALSLAQAALGGCTTVAAFEYLHPADEDFVMPVVEAARRIGLRLMYVRGSAPRLEAALADRLASSGVDISRLVEPEGRALAGTARVLGLPTSERLRWACGPTTPVLDDDGEFQAALTEVADRAGVGIHTHFHPLEGSRRPGEDAVALAARLGLLRSGNWFAHGSRLTAEDVAGLGRAGVGVVHCPSCSVALGYQIPDLSAWRSGNDRVAVAVDGAASNDRGSMLLEWQTAWWLQRARPSGASTAPGPAMMLELVTKGPARAIGWPELGSLEVGHPADLSIVALDTLEMAGSAAPPSHVLHRLLRTYGGGSVRDLFVGGRAVVTDGELVGLDKATLVADANAAARRLYPELTEQAVLS